MCQCCYNIFFCKQILTLCFACPDESVIEAQIPLQCCGKKQPFHHTLHTPNVLLTHCTLLSIFGIVWCVYKHTGLNTGHWTDIYRQTYKAFNEVSLLKTVEHGFLIDTLLDFDISEESEWCMLCKSSICGYLPLMVVYGFFFNYIIYYNI